MSTRAGDGRQPMTSPDGHQGRVIGQYRRNTMKKTRTSRIQMNDMIETHKRIGERPLAAAELKQVTGGAMCQGGMTTDSGDSAE